MGIMEESGNYYVTIRFILGFWWGIREYTNREHIGVIFPCSLLSTSKKGYWLCAVYLPKPLRTDSR